VGSVNDRKEEQIKTKNTKLMNQIKKYERKNKQLKDRINKSLMNQIQQGNMPSIDQMPALQQILMMNEDNEDDEDDEGEGGDDGL